MSAQPQPHEGPRLYAVDPSTGESHEVDGCPQCLAKDEFIAALEDQLKGAERDLNAWRIRHAELKRDKEAEARKDPLWPDAVRLFRFYCRMTGKDGKARRLTWTFERFELVRPFLKKHGISMCERAIVGRVFDHYSARRKNGSVIRYHEWERIFKDAKEFEESANRAPSDFVSELEAEDEARVVAAREA